MAYSKIILNTETLMDVTTDTVTSNAMLSGTTATKNDGTKITGSLATKTSSDLTVSGATVTVPAGCYTSNASKSVSTMTLPTSTSASATSGYTSKATVSRSASDQYINIPTGYNTAGGYYKINATANGSATPASTISGTSATVSTGTNTLTLSKTVSNTPQVSAGYISSGTAGNSNVSLTASVTTQGAQTLHPSTTDQTITGSKYLTGTQTFKAVTISNLNADNIKSGVTVKIGDSTDDDCVTSVTGTYSGGGGASNVVGGTYTTGNGGSAETITLPYTGSGFPVQVVFSLAEGTYNSSGTAYNTIHQYGIVYFIVCKANATSPTYTYDSSGFASRYVRYKSSSSASATTGGNAVMDGDYYSNYSASSSTWDSFIQINSSTALSVFVSSQSGERGLLPNTDYYYSVVYSS